MKKLFTLFSALLASATIWAATPAQLTFSEPTALPEHYVYSASNTPIIAEKYDKSCVYITNGGGGSVVADCWTEDGGLNDSKGKRWMGFTVDEDCSLSILVQSSKKKFSLYGSDATAVAEFTNTVNNAWEEWTIESLKAGSYILTTGNSQCYVAAIVFNGGAPAPTCEAPATALTLDADKKTDVAVGDIITFATAGGNGADVVIKDGTNVISNPWTATAGQHSFTASQEEKDGVCGGVTEALIINVESHDPVTAATVSGPKEAFVGDEIMLTCEAANATAFQWYKGAAQIAGATNATYTFTPDAAGELTFACEATNAYTATPVKSVDFKVTVSVKPAEPTVLVKWDADAAKRIGSITYGPSSVEEGEVKIHKDADKVKGFKFGSSYSYADGKFVTFKPAEDGFEAGDIVSLSVCYNNSSEKNAAVALYAADGATLLFTTENGVNGKLSADDPAVETFTLENDMDSLFIGRSGNTSTYVILLQVIRPAEAAQVPRLSVSPAEVTLKVTPKQSASSATVKFTGKNLTPGEHSLTLPNLAGLTVNPTAVTVAADGKLNAEVTLTYTSTEDVPAAAAEIALTINDLTAKVAINYSASVTVTYAKSLNIEQLIINKGKTADIKAAFEAAGYSAANYDELDSLNKGKDYNNYPFLGLKLKKENASVSFNLKAGSTANLKFGNVGADFRILLDGEENIVTSAYANMQADDSIPYVINATEDTYVEIISGSTKTLVLKQLMIDEPICLVDAEKGVDPEKSNDATIKSLTINGELITRNRLTFAYEVPAELDLAEVEVLYELNDSNAVGDPASGFKVAVPAAGAPANEQALVVTAENGNQLEYTISVTRAQSEEAITNAKANAKAIKTIRNGQLLIIRDGRTFNVLGTPFL